MVSNTNPTTGYQEEVPINKSSSKTSKIPKIDFTSGSNKTISKDSQEILQQNSFVGSSCTRKNSTSKRIGHKKTARSSSANSSPQRPIFSKIEEVQQDPVKLEDLIPSETNQELISQYFNYYSVIDLYKIVKEKSKLIENEKKDKVNFDKFAKSIGRSGPSLQTQLKRIKLFDDNLISLIKTKSEDDPEEAARIRLISKTRLDRGKRKLRFFKFVPKFCSKNSGNINEHDKEYNNIEIMTETPQNLLSKRPQRPNSSLELKNLAINFSLLKHKSDILIYSLSAGPSRNEFLSDILKEFIEGLAEYTHCNISSIIRILKAFVQVSFDFKCLAKWAAHRSLMYKQKMSLVG
jgi:hypothetical protein